MRNKQFLEVLLISTVVFLIAHSAQLYAYVTTPKDLYFLGGHVPTSAEIVDMIYSQLKEGFIFSKNLFTSELQPRIFIPTSYLFLLFIFKIFQFNDFIVWSICKFVYIFAFNLVFLKFISVSFKDFSDKIKLLLLLIFSSGTGFVFKLFIPDSIDLWVPEFTVFHSFLYIPVFVYNQILLVSTFYALYEFYFSKKFKYSLIASFCLFLLSLEHQFDVLTVLLTMFLLLGFVRKNLFDIIKDYKYLFFIFLPALLMILIQFVQINYFSNVKAWTMQNFLGTSSLESLISGFGILGIFALSYLSKTSWTKLDTFMKINLFWLLSEILLVFSPAPFQRRFFEGIYIPLTVLSYFEVEKFLGYLRSKFLWKKKFIGGIYFIFFLILSSSNIFLIVQDFRAFSNNKFNSYYYIYKTDLQGLDFLKNHSRDGDIILSDGFYSHIIPGLSGRSVYFGHSVGTALTIKPEEKMNNAINFFTKYSDMEKKNFLIKNNIKFLFLGKKSSSADDFHTWEKKDYLKMIYNIDNVKIFKVKS